MSPFHPVKNTGQANRNREGAYPSAYPAGCFAMGNLMRMEAGRAGGIEKGRNIFPFGDDIP